MKDKQSMTKPEQQAFARFAQQVVKPGEPAAVNSKDLDSHKTSSRFAFKLKRALQWKNEKN